MYSLRPLVKVCRSRTSDCINSVKLFTSARNLGTAPERSDIYRTFDDNIAENPLEYKNYNPNNHFSGRSVGVEPNRKDDGAYNNQNNLFNSIRIDGAEQNQNPNGVYGMNPNGHYGNSASGYTQNHNGMYGSTFMNGQFQNNRNDYNAPNPEMYQQNSVVDHNAEVHQPKSKIEDLDELCKEGKLKEAVELLQSLDTESIEIDLPRYMALIKSCGENKSLDEAKIVHEHLTKSVPNLETKSYNKILEMYSKCGSMEDASKLFDKMPKRNLTSWDIMISGLAQNGFGEDSLDLFAEFKRSGLKPDAQMFIGVFLACGEVCDIIEGTLHFTSMTKDYEITPSMDHYIAMVNMLGASGCLDEALEFIEEMPVKPNVEIYEMLMKFSRIHGNTELGDRCTELVEILDPTRLNDQSRSGLIPIDLADVAREKEKKKLSGHNLLEARSRVHEYRAGDRSHPDHEKIYTLLRGLRQQMKEVGYVAEVKFVLHDVDFESKEEALMAHSERLAAAQGFMTTPARSSLRIIKNLRVCGDCHNAFKIISKIVGREIIARDSKRFHHFKDGVCSCNDYW